MTEFNVEVVKLESSERHPNADLLSIAHIFGGYPVVYKTESFKVGDKLVYIPIDSLVPLDDPRFSFLSENADKKTQRIKAKKLRGVFSMGMLVPADPEWKVGENVQEKLRIQKWEPPPPKNCHINAYSEQAKDPGIIPIYTDLDSLRKYKNVLLEDEEVVITEKLHGANARYVYGNDEMWCGSHRTFKKRDERNMWWQVAIKYDLEKILSENPDTALYGEVYGQVQDLRYETQQGELRFAAFDLYDAKAGKYFDYDEFAAFCARYSIPCVPVLYRGPWKKELWELAEGQSSIAPSHCREGIVVRPAKERWNDRMGRVILKLVGQSYLLRKGA